VPFGKSNPQSVGQDSKNARVETRHAGALRRIYEADRALSKQGHGPKPFRLGFSGLDGRIHHPCWDSSWSVPLGETIDDLGELGLLRVEPSSNKVRVFSLSMEGRKEAAGRLDSTVEPVKPAPSTQARDPRKVAVMHGRDSRARQWMYDWLRRLGLVPLEWGHLVELTGKATPYSGEAVEAAFGTAQAVVVLFTPDEIGVLHPELSDGDRAGSDGGAQPRLNVILEAGMALQSHQDQTVLVEIGPTRPISDLGGRNTVRLTGAAKGLSELANRLEGAGCAVDKTGTDWLETGDLAELPALRRTADLKGVTPPGGIAVVGPTGSSYRVFRARGERIECRVHDGKQWAGWSDVGVLAEQPIGLASATVGPGHIEIFALLPRGEVMHNWWRYEDGWQTEFQSLGRPFGGQPVTWISAGSREVGHQEVFVEAASGEIAHIWWSSPDSAFSPQRV
jgi:hypothetical protein